ncbi:hypothetical protein A0H81_05313 [Grifola frondosa]|uniref:DUF6533 domain-containing protein n=1 Tax=Grifola frondosa TaxID=5627 RepID=A0A1C7MC86_GRIFR|nr:hypothetical protein A0H81_05313 [Grifola frondosa]
MAGSAITIVHSNVVNRYLSSVAFALLYYDFVLTIPMEVERYWNGGRSWTSLFFFVNRYLSVLSHIPVIVEFFGIISEVLQLYHQLIAALTQCIVAILLMLRTYALYGRSRGILYLLIGICCLGGIVSLWAIISVRTSQVVSYTDLIAATGCDLTLTTKQGYYLAAAWSSILVFDGAVFVLTLIKALQVGRTWSGSLFKIMLRDGTIYFGVLLICYLFNILTYVLAEPINKGVSTTITNVISSTLITRLMLNIRDPDLVELPHRWRSDLNLNL